MSINRNMKKATLEVKLEKKTDSGALKSDWYYLKEINIAIYDLDDRVVMTNVKYSESTHTALTREKNIKKDINKIIVGEEEYIVLSSKNQGKFNNLILKRI